ncbi:MAG: hypothetical protein J7K12_00230 [Thermoplasmata archaeon]|nr:hypothetical protein [Thermoplasmata archaeon]
MRKLRARKSCTRDIKLKICIFGSFVRGEERKEYLSKLLGRRVDLMRKQAIREELIQKIYQMR